MSNPNSKEKKAMKKWILVGIVVLSAGLFCGGLNPAFSAEKINYTGCGIVKRAFMDQLSKKFTQQYGIDVNIEGGGATRGIREVASGEKNLGGTCRHALDIPEEKGVTLHHVAWDALVVIVNKSNPVNTISLDQLKAVVEGKTKDWGELGGPAHTPLKYYDRKGKSSGVGLMAREILFHDSNKDFDIAQAYQDSGPMEQAIEKDRWAIGITGISSARKRNVKILELNGIDTSKQNIASGKYLLYRPLYLVTKSTPDPTTAKFIQFALSKEGQQIISEQGTVNLREGANLWRLYRMQMHE
jgi:phosphate transport system substrate-binding protein